jgi:hypothetical protein
LARFRIENAIGLHRVDFGRIESQRTRDFGVVLPEIRGNVPNRRIAIGKPEGRLAHLGVMCEDLEAALAAARRFEVVEMPQGRNWLRLPDGLAVELIQARPASCVAQALAINPRA